MSKLFLGKRRVDEKSMEYVPKSEVSDSERQPLLEEDETVQRSGSGAAGPKDGGTSYKKQGANEVATFFNFAKASIGSGSFALPWGILQAGVLVGGFGMILLGIASVYTMQLMLECKRYVTAKLSSPKKRQSLNYTELGRHAMGRFGKWAVDVSVLACNLGVCAGYMIFIAGNLHWAANCFEDKIYNHYHHNNSHDNLTFDLEYGEINSDEGKRVCFTIMEVYALVLPILIALTFLPSFKILAYSAYIGSVFLVLAVSVVYVFGFIDHHVFCAVEESDIRYVPTKPTGIALWFGVTAFLFCVHSMVIPLETVMKRPKNMPYVLDAACLIVLAINLPFAIYGYILFGSATKGYVFENLPGGVFYDLVRVFLSVELTLTFPIVFKPASDVAEEIWYNFLMMFVKCGRLKIVKELYTNTSINYRVGRYIMLCVLRTLLVLVSWSIAVSIPRFELCLALVGSLATTILAFILPPLFHLTLKWRITSLARRVFHILLLISGILASVAATSINLYTAITDRGGSTSCSAIREQCQAIDTPTAHCNS